MTNINLTGKICQYNILQCLGDHPKYEYDLEQLQDNIGFDVYRDVKELFRWGLLTKNRGKYKINTEHRIIKAVLKTDMEIASKIAQEEANK